MKIHFREDTARAFERRRRQFSLASTLVVLTGFAVLAYTTHESEAFGIVEAGVAFGIGLLVYLLRVWLWRCPTCSAPLEMGGLHVSDLRRSHRIACKRCGATYP